jgi:hypothetical protein
MRASWQTFQFECRIDRYDAIDLAVWVLVVLAGVDFLRVEEDCCDGHVEGGRRGRRYLLLEACMSGWWSK